MITKRALSDSMYRAFQSGSLRPISERVVEDRDLILEFRGSYANVYCKGQNLVKIEESRGRYICSTDKKFAKSVTSFQSIIESEQHSQILLSQFPFLKDNIARHKSSCSEIEAEQSLIRANNYESKINSEYFLLDRQCSEGGADKNGRPDMLGLKWPHAGRSRNQSLPLVLFEVKYSLNNDIKSVAAQLSGYHDLVTRNIKPLAEDCERLFRQKLELGLFKGQSERQDALKTLKVSADINKVEYVILLADYNPYSTLLNIEKIRSLEFADRISIFYVGFGLWQPNRTKIVPGYTNSL